jgi:Spy/CpxP family protein refolding chaperone
MDNIAKNRWQVRVAAVVIFLLGVAAGVLGLNVYRSWARGLPARQGFEQFAVRLQLNNDQKTKVQQIFADTREQLRALRKESEPRVDGIRKQADDRLQQVLTPEQWQRFQKMRDETRQRRGHGPRTDGP